MQICPLVWFPCPSCLPGRSRMQWPCVSCSPGWRRRYAYFRVCVVCVPVTPLWIVSVHAARHKEHSGWSIRFQHQPLWLGVIHRQGHCHVSFLIQSKGGMGLAHVTPLDLPRRVWQPCAHTHAHGDAFGVSPCVSAPLLNASEPNWGSTQKLRHVGVCSVKSRQIEKHAFTFTFSHLADAFVQSDVQGREYSSYEQ